MCLCVILAGNWVLLIFVWGCRFCSNIAHMHIKLLYELNTCLRLCSSSSSLALLQKLPVNITKTVTRPLPSPHLTSSHHSQLAKQWFGDRWCRYDAFVSLLQALKPPGKHADEVLTLLTHYSDCYQSNVIVYLLIFSWHFISSVVLIDHIYLFSHLHLLFNNNPLPSFILSVMGEFLRYCSLLFSYQGFIRWFPVPPCIFPFLSPVCPLCATLLVSVSIGSGSSLWVCMAGVLTVTACLALEWHIN